MESAKSSSKTLERGAECRLEAQVPQLQRTIRWTTNKRSFKRGFWLAVCGCSVFYLGMVWYFSLSIYATPKPSIRNPTQQLVGEMKPMEENVLQQPQLSEQQASADLPTASASPDAAAMLVAAIQQIAKEKAQHKDIMDIVRSSSRPNKQDGGVDVNITAIREAEQHARNVKPLPIGDIKIRNLQCVGWRATEDCDPDGLRNPAKDRSCSQYVAPIASGYCEVRDTDTGELFRVMRRHCDSITHGVKYFKCSDAWDFGAFSAQAHEAIQIALQPGFALPHVANYSESTSESVVDKGIVMVVYPKLIPSSFATIRALRAQNCTLPIEIWYRTDETNPSHPVLEVLATKYGPVTFCSIDEPRATGFATKIHAIYHSHFQNVLFLDADNVPVKDPTYLFDLPEFQESGALFWPDFWHPDNTIFNIKKTSLLWELLDMPFVNMFEQESGQLLIDRRRSIAALELVRFFAIHRPNHFENLKLAHGDKDLFRLAWLKTKQPFEMIKFPPSVAGALQGDTFCGMTMVQHDPKGEIVFLHRNAKKLHGRMMAYNGLTNPFEDGMKITPGTEKDDADALSDPVVWTHVLLFKPTSSRIDYRIDIYEGQPDFPKGQWCYGQRSVAAPHFNTLEFQAFPFAEKLETTLREYAEEATQYVFHEFNLRRSNPIRLRS